MAQRGLGTWDLILEGDGLKMGFNLAVEPGKPATEPFELGPGRADEAIRNADVARVVDNLDAGMGYSRRLEGTPNGYAYALPGHTRSPGAIFCPAGKLTEIALPAAGTGAGQWTPGPIMDSTFFGDAGGQVYLAGSGRHVLAIAFDGASAVVANDFGAGFQAQSLAVFNNRLYVGGGGGLGYRDVPPGGFSVATGTVRRGHLTVVTWRPLGVPTQVLIGSSLDFQGGAVRWCPITADPMVDANWVAPVPVGEDRRYPINRIVAAPQRAYMLRADGVYDLDELGTRAFNIAPWVRENVDGLNGVWGTHLGDGLYYSTARGMAYIPTSGEAQYRPEWAQPGWGLPYEGPVAGIPYAGTLDAGWGLAAICDNVQSYVMAGRRDASGQGGGRATHVWHGAEAIIPGKVTHMKVHTLGLTAAAPRLLIATGDGTAGNPVRCFWQSLSKVGSPLQEMLWGGGFEPADAASLFLPADPWARPSSVKTLLQLEMVTERLEPGGDVLKAYASADGGAWADQGTVEDSPYGSLAPLETTEGRFVSVRVDAVGHPILRSLELRAALGVELREARTYRVILAWDNALRGATRGRETADPERRLSDLRSLLGRVVALSDASTREPRRARVLQVQGGERRRLGGAPRAGSNGAEGAWAVVCPVTVSFIDAPFRWDGPQRTDLWDADRVYT